MGQPLVYLEVFWYHPDTHGILQYGIEFVAIEDKEVLGAASRCGGGAAWGIYGNPP